MTLSGAGVNLATDPLLPQRDLLLNADEVARRLSSVLVTYGTLTIDSCNRIRTKYRFGESLRVLHRVTARGSELIVAARTFPKGVCEEAYERARSQAIENTPIKAVACDQELHTIFWTFPNDRKLSGLRFLASVPPRFPASVVPGWTGSRVIAYAPEKCATAECLDAESNVLAYAKVYRGSEGERVFRLYQSLERSLSQRGAGLQLPRALAYSKAHRMLLLERIEGSHLADLQDKDKTLRGYRQLGAALATLHGLSIPEGLPSFRRLELKRIRQAARIIGQARPDVRKEALELAEKLTALRDFKSERVVCLHGDVHPKNGIQTQDGLTLIDMDQAAVGDPAADIGSFLASLSYNHLTGVLSHARAQRLAEAFLSGYADAGSLPAETSLSWYTAAALLAERALRAVNRVRAEGLDCLSELIDEAHQILLPGGKR